MLTKHSGCLWRARGDSSVIVLICGGMVKRPVPCCRAAVGSKVVFHTIVKTSIPDFTVSMRAPRGPLSVSDAEQSAKLCFMCFPFIFLCLTPCPHPRVHQTLSPVFVTWQGDGCVLSTVSGQLTFTCGFFLESWLEIPGFHGFVFLTFSLIFTEHPAFALLPLCVRPTSVLWRGLTTSSWNQVQPSWNHDIFLLSSEFCI